MLSPVSVRPVSVAGAASLVAARLPETLEAAIHGTVMQAVRAAGLRSIDEIQMVVTVASDVLDGIMVPPRSEIAASVGRQYLDVPSSAGHALAAAAVLVESGQVEDLLLVGWGEGHKVAAHDSRAIQADPFYARPVGGVPAAMAALQAQRLLATGRHRPEALDAYVALMAARAAAGAAASATASAVASAMADAAAAAAAGIASSTPASAALPRWLRTRWVDGVAAVVLTSRPRSASAGSVRLVDVASASRGYWPEDGELDPLQWIREAVVSADGRPRPAAQHADVIEVGATTPVCELHALDAFGGRGTDVGASAGADPAFRRAGVNTSGGGAAACFGPATGLLRLIAATRALQAAQGADTAAGAGTRSAGAGARSATVVDLAGPIGQSVTVARLERRHG